MNKEQILFKIIEIQSRYIKLLSAKLATAAPMTEVLSKEAISIRAEMKHYQKELMG